MSLRCDRCKKVFGDNSEISELRRQNEQLHKLNALLLAENKELLSTLKLARFINTVLLFLVIPRPKLVYLVLLQ